MRLEELQPNASINGILPNGQVTVVSVQWFGSDALELTSCYDRQRLGWVKTVDDMHRGDKLRL